jgi:UPF0755 protein
LKKLRNILAALLLFCLMAGAGGIYWFSGAVSAPGPLETEKLVYIAPATRIKAMAAQLAAEGVVSNALVFEAAARLQSRLKPLQAGEYAFPPHVSAAGAVALLQSGKTYQRKLTLPEGLMSLEIVNILKAEPALSGEISAVPPDGSLLPETYQFSYGDTRQSILDRMHKGMGEALDALWEKRAEDFRLSKEETVVLASIVEKETGVAAERPRVAGVFLNRMHRGMPLQSDPTVIYALTLGQSVLERPLTLADLKKPSPFNTYLASGLPPAPIANPGRASLEAVLGAEKHDYLYFVADGSGGHAFSKTLQEHNSNVAKWRAFQKSRQK